jgi:hypothetical protein
MRLPSRLPYSPLLRDCDGADRVSEDPGRIVVAAGRLAGRRDLGVVVLGRDEVDFGLAVADSPDAEVSMAELSTPAEPDELAAPDLPVGREVRDAPRELGRVDVDLGLAAGRRPAVVRAAAVVRLVGAAAAGFADCIVLAAAVRAFAAVVMALVAVFIARMADDIVLADADALVAAAVILPAADVTLVAADDTVLAAVAGVAEVRPAVVRRAAVVRPAVARVPVLVVPAVRLVVLLRAAVVRAPVVRAAVDRDADPRVDREVVLRADVPAEPADDVAAVPREDLELDVDCGRLAVPLDALRLTDLLRAVLAEPRRVAARVVD